VKEEEERKRKKLEEEERKRNKKEEEEDSKKKEKDKPIKESAVIKPTIKISDLSDDDGRGRLEEKDPLKTTHHERTSDHSGLLSPGGSWLRHQVSPVQQSHGSGMRQVR